MDKFREETYIPFNQRKKILLLSDDLRMPSGVGTMSREIVLGTCQRYNWFQVGAAINHPEMGKLADLSQDVSKETGVPDPYVKVLPYNGYGDEMLIRQIVQNEKIDAILHYTDPRFWIWLYQMEHEIRQKMPILFYHVWDNLPYPMYNKPYYESCDWFGCISKQTKNIVETVRTDLKEWQIDYIPHGIDSKKFYPIEEGMSPNFPEENKRMQEIKSQIFRGENPDFIILYNNRNIRRKQASNTILAFRLFLNKLPKEKADKCVLLLHTQPIDDNGTDLISVASTLAPDAKILFSSGKVDFKDLNIIYNISDVTINMANAEGFGLSTAESIMTGTPVIATVTGGLQDQMRFLDENDVPISFNKDWGSNSDGKYKTKYGEWVFPLFPKARSLTGSPLTPYIFDDYSDWQEASEVLMEIYNMPREERKKRGKVGREWMLTKESGMEMVEMSSRFIKGIDTTLQNWTHRKKYEMFKV